MPALSKQQYKFFKAVANSPEMQKKTGISKQTAEEFTKDNIGKKAYKKLVIRKGRTK